MYILESAYQWGGVTFWQVTYNLQGSVLQILIYLKSIWRIQFRPGNNYKITQLCNDCWDANLLAILQKIYKSIFKWKVIRLVVGMYLVPSVTHSL